MDILFAAFIAASFLWQVLIVLAVSFVGGFLVWAVLQFIALLIEHYEWYDYKRDIEELSKHEDLL